MKIYATMAGHSSGRIALHLLATLRRPRNWRFHVAGIIRELA